MSIVQTRRGLKFLAWILAGALLQNTLMYAQASVAAGQATVDVWDGVHGLPPGTRLKVAFTNGSEVTGTVVATAAEQVVLRDNQPGAAGLKMTSATGFDLRQNMTFARSEITGATVISMATRYVADSAPDVVAVRYVTRALGAGRRVNLSTSTQRIRGRIESVGPESLIVVHGSPSTPQQIAYNDVRRIEPRGMGGVTKGLLIGGATVGALMIAYAMALANCGSC